MDNIQHQTGTESSLDMFLTMMSTPTVHVQDTNHEHQNNHTTTTTTSKQFCAYCGTDLTSATSSSSPRHSITCTSCHRHCIREPPPLDAPNGGGDGDDGWDDRRGDDEEENNKHPSSPASFLLFEPPTHNDIIYGYVERHRGPDIVSFHLFNAADDSFVLGATMRRGGMKSEAISLHTRRDIKATGKFSDITIPKYLVDEGYVGSLIPQALLGTGFVICDGPEFNLQADKKKAPIVTSFPKPPTTTNNDSDHDEDSPSHHIPSRQQGIDYGLVTYAPNVMGMAPNSFSLTVRCNPHTSIITKSLRERLREVSVTRYDTETTLWERVSRINTTLYQALSSTEDGDEIATFETKKAEWNGDLGGWTMDFNGRVSVSSKKNCILIPVDERAFGHDTTCLRFGKVTKHRFALDYRWPLSPAVALATVVTLFANKLAVL